ncbi:MAG: EAL domain-containing protein [Oceanospirillaceae bacterium]|nr:EAL domain-containing protein [Oceanospirillaceae bacterium]
MDSSKSLSSNSSLLEKADTGPVRKNIYIIFVEFDSTHTSSIISFLRDNQFAPRGKNLDTMDELLTTLSERSWDLILCKSQFSSFDPFLMSRELAALEKDIPVIQLHQQPTPQDITQALLNKIQAVLPIDDHPLLLLFIQREYAQLEDRRQARQLQQRLEDSKKRCKLLMDHSALSIAFLDNHRIVYLNEAFCQLFGYQVTALLLNKSILKLVASGERTGVEQLIATFGDNGHTRQTYQLLAQRADKSNFTAHIELQQIEFKDRECIEILINSKQQQLNKNIFEDMDAITGLYNLNHFTNALESIVRQAQRGGHDCHLIYINIINLLSIRSQLGSEASRSLARDCADIMNDELSKVHLKARISDNTFAIVYSDPDMQKSKVIATALFDRLSNHITHFEDNLIEPQYIVAIVPLTDTSPSVQCLLERGQTTISHCNAQPQVTVFNAEKDELSNSDVQSITQVKSALKKDQLQLLFQPLVPLVFNSKYQHYEVLLRLIDENNRSLPPAQFLSSIGNADLNEEMDRWVISQSINRFREQLDKKQQLKLFISVTDTVWQREGLLLWLAEQLRLSRIQADHIVIQISESESANKLSEAEFFVNGLRQLNCLVCLKHYGSTNNSKAILETLNPDYVKFDGSFIQELADDAILDSNFAALLSNLTNLGKVTIAPQVEHPHVMSLLWKSGLGMVQGYYLQPPEKEMDYQF